MGYLETGKATQSPDFLLRVQVATFVVARRILEESGDETVPGYTQRQALAKQVLADPTRRIQQFLWLAASDPIVVAKVKVDADPTKVKVEATDENILAAIEANWDAIAGWHGY